MPQTQFGETKVRLQRLDRLGRQRGQSMVEYLIICAGLAVALFAPLPGSQQAAGEFLAEKLRQVYLALTFFLSLP